MSSEDLQAEARRLESRIRELVQPSSSLLLGTLKPKAEVRTELRQCITRFLHVTQDDNDAAQKKVDDWKREACMVDPTLRPDDFVPDSNDGLDSREGSAEGSSRRSSMSVDTFGPNFPNIPYLSEPQVPLGQVGVLFNESYIRHGAPPPLPPKTQTAPGLNRRS